MLQNKIKYKGIVRAGSHQEIQDGWMDELINLRYRDEKLCPVGHPTKLYGLPNQDDPPNTFLDIWKHEQDNIDNYIGLTDEYALGLIDMEVGTSKPIKQYSGLVQVVFLKRFMIVIHDDGMDRFLYKNEEYNLITITQEPVFLLSVLEEEYTWTDWAATAEAILGKYFARLNTISNENKFTGGFMVRAAYKLFDGSYIFHTLPYFISIENHKIVLNWHGTYNTFRTEFYAAKAKIIFSSIDYTDMESNRDVIQSIVLFATKAESLLEISENTITEDNLEEWKTQDDECLNNKLEVSADFKDMPDSASWYKVGEYSFSGILDGDITEEELDLKNFYQDYATRETLPVDQFSHHILAGSIAMNYNSRLVLEDTKQTLALKAIYEHKADELPFTSGGVEYKYIKYSDKYIDLAVKFIIDTDAGEKTVWILQTVNEWYVNTLTTWEHYIVLNGVIGYPDVRAKECMLYVKDDEIYKYLITLKLTASKSMNFAYYHSNQFLSGEYDGILGTLILGGKYWNFNMISLYFNRINTPKLPTDNTLNTEIPPDNEITDKNRIQISEVNNPFYFAAENSYQVGTGTIIACATNTEPLSTGQFGEYPLIVFTSKGIWTLFQGQGDVLFSSVKPLNGEVAISPEHIISTGTGVTYSTERGLYLIEGRNVVHLSQLLHGLPNLDIQEVDNYILRLNHLSLVQIDASLSIIDAKSYILGAKVGFDKKNNELLVTNNTYDYSYVFSFESKLWHKINESFRVLINSYPELLVLRENSSDDGVFSVSQGSYATPVATMLTTRPCKLDNEVDFTLLHRAIQRCEIETAESTYAGLYVFGSNDLRTWQLLSGNDRKTGKITDILTTRVHHKVKYFVFVFAAILTEYSSINNLDIQFYSKITNKLR